MPAIPLSIRSPGTRALSFSSHSLLFSSKNKVVDPVRLDTAWWNWIKDIPGASSSCRSWMVDATLDIGTATDDQLLATAFWPRAALVCGSRGLDFSAIPENRYDDYKEGVYQRARVVLFGWGDSGVVLDLSRMEEMIRADDPVEAFVASEMYRYNAPKELPSDDPFGPLTDPITARNLVRPRTPTIQECRDYSLTHGFSVRLP